MTIRSLILTKAIEKSSSGYYLINKNNNKIIERESFTVSSKDKVVVHQISETDLNNCGLVTVALILRSSSVLELEILKYVANDKYFQIDYRMDTNEKTITERIIKKEFVDLVKQNKYICYSANDCSSGIATSTIDNHKQQAANYFLISLARYMLIIQNHSLNIKDKDKKVEFKYLRITGVCKGNKKDLNEYKIQDKAAKVNDHRQLNKDAQIYLFDEEIGCGLPMILENGVIVEHAIETYFRNSPLFQHAKFISTPIFARLELYKRSGHWENYQESMFPPICHNDSNEKLILRPMTCPHHCIVFKNRKYSVEDMPITYCENALLFRYEASGALLGLERTRQMKLFDTHTFVEAKHELVVQEIRRNLRTAKTVLNDFKIKISYFRLSVNEETENEKFIKDPNVWNKANHWIEEALRNEQIVYQKKKGHAAFYGPKIDIQTQTVIGNEITLATIQVDLVLAKKLSCCTLTGEHPAIIHTGFIGTYERFISILLEQNRGFLPFICNPYQLIIIPLSNKFNQPTKELAEKFKLINVKCWVNNTDSHINEKIKDVFRKKANFFVVIGNNEVKTQEFILEEPKTHKHYKIHIKNLIKIFEYAY